MEGWGKIVAGVVLGVAGTVYATNEGVRRRLPKSARDLPDNVRQRFENAVSAAREASTRRREEILRDLAAHEAHADRIAREAAAARLAEDEASEDEASEDEASEDEASNVTERTEEGSA